MQRLCNWLLVERETADPSSIFSLFNLTPNRLFFTANSFFLRKPSSAEKTHSSARNGDLFFLRLQLLWRFLFSYFFLFFPFHLLHRLYPRESGADTGVGPNSS